MKDFKGKVVVVTGAATGIGFALARQLAFKGAKVVIAGRRRDRLEAAASMLASDGAEVAWFECDVTDRAQVVGLADHAEASFGPVDVIINNAGVGPIASTVIDALADDVRSVLDINLFGTWHGVSVFGERFVRRGMPAAIYNVGSENCFFNAVPYGAGYVASKHAVLAMTYALREEVPDFIEVGLICPGLVKSELSRETSLGMDTDDYARRVLEQLVAGEFLIVSHAYNMVHIRARFDEIEGAYERWAPRHKGDDAFDVRHLGEARQWFTKPPAARSARP